MEMHVSATELVEKVFDTLKAYLVDKIRYKVSRSSKPLVDMLTQADKDNDGFLSKEELSLMLLNELDINIKENVFEPILMREILDRRGAGKVSIKNLKLYFAVG
jgi:Ca2+-binding EF-hand superfamily protein